jgi:ethanolamine utilization microcompartment shell protein EutS
MSFYRGDGGTGSGDIVNTPLQISQGGTNSTTAAGARTNLGLGTLATQNADNVSITGGTIAASAIPSLATVATTGNYNDLSNKPTLVSSLDSLTDVVIGSGVAVNQVLLYNGSGWVNNDIVLTATGMEAAFGDNILVSADVGVVLQPYDANLKDFVDTFTLPTTAGSTGQVLMIGAGSAGTTLTFSSLDVGVTTFNGRSGAVTLTTADIDNALGDIVLTSADIGVLVQPYDANILVSGDIGVVVQAYDSNLTQFVNTFTLPTADGTVNQFIKTDGAGNLVFASGAAGGGVDTFNGRSGTVTLTSADIVSAVGDLVLKSADIGVKVQAYDANILKSGDIGVKVLGYDANLAEFVLDFTLPSADGTNGQVLTTNGSGTLSFASASTVGTLNDLSDVTITSPSADQIIRYNASASQWINVQLPSYLPVTKYDTTTVQVTIANGSIAVTNRAGGTVNVSVV